MADRPDTIYDPAAESRPSSVTVVWRQGVNPLSGTFLSVPEGDDLRDTSVDGSRAVHVRRQSVSKVIAHIQATWQIAKSAVTIPSDVEESEEVD